PAVSVGGISRGQSSSETYAEHATPKSTPQPGSLFGGAGSAPACTPKLICQVPEPSTVTVALRTSPGVRDHRNRTQPILGSRTCPHFRFSRCSETAWPGNGTDSRALRFFSSGACAGCSGFHQLS